jgi:membrane fusion protein, multidrug efflux system
MSRSKIRLFSLIGIGLLAVVFIVYRMGWFEGKTEAPAAEVKPGGGGQILPVQGFIVKAAPLEDYIEVNGSTIPEEEVQISSEIGGKVAKILFEEGAKVEKGAVLLRIHDEEWKAQREKLAVQKNLAEKIANRLKALLEKEGVSLQEYEVAAAEVDRFEADIKLLDVQLEKTVIRAPFGGVLGFRQISEGSFVSPGAPIVSLVRKDPIHIRFSIPERYGNDLQAGGKITFQAAGIPGEIPATVIARDPVIDASTRSVSFEAKAANPGGRILPGAFTLVRVQLRRYEEALLAPTEAVIPELGGKKVYLYKNGKAQPVEVETGIRQDRAIQVLKGLAPGDTLIASGVLQLRPDMPVSISGWTSIQ